MAQEAPHEKCEFSKLHRLCLMSALDDAEETAYEAAPKQQKLREKLIQRKKRYISKDIKKCYLGRVKTLNLKTKQAVSGYREYQTNLCIICAGEFEAFEINTYGLQYQSNLVEERTEIADKDTQSEIRFAAF